MIRGFKLEDPIIETDENWFTITFKRPDLQKGSYEQRLYGSQKSSQKILDLIEQNPAITIEELAGKLSLTSRAIKKNLAKLKEQRLLKRIGPDKGGYWKVLRR